MPRTKKVNSILNPFWDNVLFWCVQGAHRKGKISLKWVTAGNFEYKNISTSMKQDSLTKTCFYNFLLELFKLKYLNSRTKATTMGA